MDLCQLLFGFSLRRDPLPDKDMVTDAGGEPIISRGYLFGCFGPEILVK